MRETPAAELPDIDRALRRLQREHVRAVIALTARLLSVAFLIALLTFRLPAVRQYLALVNAAGVALIAWPFFTRMGQLYAGRIRLGQRFVAVERWREAARLLDPFSHAVRARLFDAAGEGRLLLADAWRHLGKEAEADALNADLASTGNSPVAPDRKQKRKSP